MQAGDRLCPWCNMTSIFLMAVIAHCSVCGLRKANGHSGVNMQVYVRGPSVQVIRALAAHRALTIVEEYGLKSAIREKDSEE